MALPIPIVVDNFADYYSEQKKIEAKELKKEAQAKQVCFLNQVKYQLNILFARLSLMLMLRLLLTKVSSRLSATLLDHSLILPCLPTMGSRDKHDKMEQSTTSFNSQPHHRSCYFVTYGLWI